jgi:predicted enzyme related to lactoylglutathione lyase
MEPLEFLSGVLVVSKDPKRLAAFYRDQLGVPLEEEQHDDTLPHWGATLGEIHFAIHPVEDFPDGRSGVGAVKLAFTVFDLRKRIAALEAAGIALLYPPKDTGFFWTTAIQDPDGNLVELVELRDEWFQYLAHRRSQPGDLLARWHAAKEARPA